MGKVPSVDFACNDPDNGDFAGRVWAASVAGSDLERSDWGNGVRFTELDGAIRIHRRTFKVVGVTHWLGNWCWNRYFFKRQEYRRLIRIMAANGWRCTGGLVRWSDAYDSLAREPSDA